MSAYYVEPERGFTETYFGLEDALAVADVLERSGNGPVTVYQDSPNGRVYVRRVTL